MKKLFENWRTHLSEGHNPKVADYLCKAMEELFGIDNLPPGGLITIEGGSEKKQFVITKSRGGVNQNCVVPYTGPTDLQKLTAKGLGSGGGTDEPTGMPLEEQNK